MRTLVPATTSCQVFQQTGALHFCCVPAISWYGPAVRNESINKQILEADRSRNPLHPFAFILHPFPTTEVLCPAHLTTYA